MRYTFVLSALCATVLLTGCGKKIDFGQDAGITMRDERNVPQGAGDPTDWITDGTWNKTERGLFHLAPAVDLNGSQQGGVSGLSFYPNPVSSATRAAHFNSGTAQADMQLKLVFVDRKYKIIQEQDAQAAKGKNMLFALTLPADKFKADATYRLYYVYYGADGTLYYKGHGDIRIDE